MSQAGFKIPNRIFMLAPDHSEQSCAVMANLAVAEARTFMPKVTGRGARSLRPYFGPGFFGIAWSDDYIWFQEIGINPFTMRRLAGKLIPMWINDPTGEEQRKNPKAKTRRTEDGRTQVLIFRRAAKQGQRKTVVRNGVPTSVPASYPGAPGHINRREVGRPRTTAGRVAGAFARENIGVRWRHPGLTPRSFLHQGVVRAAVANQVPLSAVNVSSSSR